MVSLAGSKRFSSYVGGYIIEASKSNALKKKFRAALFGPRTG